MRSLFRIALVAAGTTCSIAAAQPPSSTPPAKARISLPWYQGGPHRATVVRAGEAAPRQSVYTSVNGKVVSVGGEDPKERGVRFGSRMTQPGQLTRKDTPAGNAVPRSATGPVDARVAGHGSRVDAGAINALPSAMTVSRDTEWGTEADAAVLDGSATGSKERPPASGDAGGSTKAAGPGTAMRPPAIIHNEIGTRHLRARPAGTDTAKPPAVKQRD